MTVQNILLLLISLVGSVYDLRFRKIPNWLTFGSFVFALIFSFFKLGLGGVTNCVLGFLVGILLLLIPYLLGGMGAGDVKLLGAIGAFAGFKSVILIFFYSAICGLFLGIIWILFTPGHLKFLIKTGQVLPTVDKKQKIPYGIAIFMGTFTYIMFGTNRIFTNLPLWQ